MKLGKCSAKKLRRKKSKFLIEEAKQIYEHLTLCELGIEYYKVTSLHFTSSDFSCTWTENFQIYKLDLGNTEKAEIKLQTYTGW